jgi:hypothetical protein
MFYRLQVIINDLKSLGEKVKDEDFSHKFLMCLPKRFKTLRTTIFRGGLKDVFPNEVLSDVMTKDQYNDDDDEVVKDEDKKKKSVAFQASTSSSKNNMIRNLLEGGSIFTIVGHKSKITCYE